MFGESEFVWLKKRSTASLSSQLETYVLFLTCVAQNYVVLAKVHVMVAKHATHLMVL